MPRSAPVKTGRSMIVVLSLGMTLAVIFSLQAPGTAGPPPRQSCPSPTETSGGQTPTATPCPSPSTTPTPTSDIECRDGIDNDGDGKIDHPTDPGCTNPNDDSELDPTPGPTPTPINGTPGSTPTPTPGPAQCEDGVDNDGDGHTDHPADPECENKKDDSEAPVLTDVAGDVSIRHRVRPKHRFKGIVTSSEAACVAGRRVVVKKVLKGRDAKIGGTRSADTGRWRLRHRLGGRGRYYAVAKVSVVGNLNCLKAVSPRIRVRR